ncbi:MAG: hypothetical protein WEC15_05940 [Flavobacteriales bacterium]
MGLAVTLAIAFAIAYLLLWVLAYVTKGKLSNGLAIVRRVWVLCVLLVSVQLFMYWGYELTFRGIWVDRVIPLLMFLSATALFALYRERLRPITKWISGAFFFYPLAAAFTFVLDRIFFVVFSSPILACVFIPHVHYSDPRWEVRSSFGLVAAKAFVLYEKSWLTERQLGSCYDDRPPGFAIHDLTVLVTTDTVRARASDGNTTYDMIFTQ